MARLRNLPLDYTEIDILKGEAKAKEHRRRNLDGRVPVLELAEGDCIAESNAILCFLAEGSDFLPRDARQRADVMRWLFFEQNAHEGTVASSRFMLALSGRPEEFTERVAMLKARGQEALDVLETRLGQADWLALERFTVADLALYPYTSVADEGGFDLDALPRIRAWIERIEAQPGLPPFSDFLAGKASA